MAIENKRYRRILDIVRETIAREAYDVHDAEEMAKYINYYLGFAHWRKRKNLGNPHKLSSNKNVIVREKSIYATIRNACARARSFHAPATLTVEQWLKTVEYFGGKCAYCQVNDYAEIEHFIPLNPGNNLGGTTASNCVPACVPCNRKKRKIHPDNLHGIIPDEAIERVQFYLSQQQS